MLGAIVFFGVLVVVAFVGGALFFRKHATRIQAAADQVKADTEKAAASIKSDAQKVNASVTAAHAGMSKVAADIKATIKG